MLRGATSGASFFSSGKLPVRDAPRQGRRSAPSRAAHSSKIEIACRRMRFDTRFSPTHQPPLVPSATSDLPSRPRMKAIRICLFILVLPIGLLVGAEPAFEIREGDRVLFIGDTLIEREGRPSELRMHEQFPDRKFIVRNLGFAGDTPLGWSRAEFDPPAKGWERLKEQLALVRPTVAVIGYGMAASLQELTDRSGDHSLNPDPVRYGAEPMSAARFKKELAQLMDAIAAHSRRTKPGIEGRETRVEGSGTRSPLRPSTLDLQHPSLHSSLPDSARRFARGKARAAGSRGAQQTPAIDYSKAIEELARERGARFVSLAAPQSNYAKFMLGNEQAPR